MSSNLTRSTNPSVSRLLAFLACAIALVYVSCIDLKGLWTDEGYRLWLMNAGQPIDFTAPLSFPPPAAIVDAVRPTNYQPLYFLLQSAVMRITHSRSEVILRLVNIPFLFAALYGLLRLIKAWSPWSKLFAVVLFSLNGYLLMEFMQVREYPLFLTIVIWATACFFVLWDAEPFNVPRYLLWLIAYWLLIVAGFYTHIWMVPFVICQALVALFRRRERRQFLFAMASVYTAALLCAAPWIVSAYLQYKSKIEPNTADWRPPTLSLFIGMLRDGWGAIIAYRAGSPSVLLDVYTAVLIVTIVALLIVLRRRAAPDTPKIACALLYMLPFVLFQTLYFFRDNPLSMWPRYFVVYVFSFVFLGTFAFELLAREAAARESLRLRWAMALFGTVVFISGVAQVARYRAWPFMDAILSWQCDWRTIAKEIPRYVRPGDTVVFYHPLLPWTMATSWPLQTRSAVYEDVFTGRYHRVPALWILDARYAFAQHGRDMTMAQLRADRYRIRETDPLKCGCQLLRLERYLGAADLEKAAKLVEGKARIRLTDLATLTRAIEAYHAANRSYPRSSGGYDGLYSRYGASTSQWISGLAPRFIRSLPRDPRADTDGSHQYLYWSDGVDYKLIDHAPEDCAAVKQAVPDAIDPARDCWAYGYWTPGAENR